MKRTLDILRTQAAAHSLFENDVYPWLCLYIQIQALSPAFDEEWEAHGKLQEAAQLLMSWCATQGGVQGLQVEIVRIPGRTPVVLIEIPMFGEMPNDDTILLYGHLDKQPKGEAAWSEGLGPWTPIRRDGRLYGRGGADDGYAAFAAIGAIRLLQEQGIPHARCVILIEGCEESGSFDLPAYMDHLAHRIGKPSLVVALDSGCQDYNHLWGTTSLRGVVAGDLTIELLKYAVHSGSAGGIVPSITRLAMQLLQRIENVDTGQIMLPELFTRIPKEVKEQALATAAILGPRLLQDFPWAQDVDPQVMLKAQNEEELTRAIGRLLLQQSWEPACTVTGADGLPPLHEAANVLLPKLTLRLSVRIPPGVKPLVAADAIRNELTRNPPHQTRVTFNPRLMASGWAAKPSAPWLAESLNRASVDFFGAPARSIGEGGTIPFMFMLGERFPDAEFLITGVLGPESNAHGPDEFLHILTFERLTCSLAHVLAAHAARS